MHHLDLTERDKKFIERNIGLSINELSRIMDKSYHKIQQYYNQIKPDSDKFRRVYLANRKKEEEKPVTLERIPAKYSNQNWNEYKPTRSNYKSTY
jgi:hypothetical protein